MDFTCRFILEMNNGKILCDLIRLDGRRNIRDVDANHGDV